MTSLTRAAMATKILAKWGSISLLVLLIGRGLLIGVINWYKAAHPKIIPPTMGFGLLPPLQFPAKDQPELTYHLETITGALPNFPSQADVLFIPAQRPNLLAMDRAIKEVAIIGYKGQAEKIDELTYRWRLILPLPSTLTMRIYDGRFNLQTEWASDPNFLVEKQLPSQTQAIKESRDFVSRLGESANDLSESTATINYLKGFAGKYQLALSLSDADFIEVNLFRNLYKNQFPFATTEPKRGIVNLILSGNRKTGRIIQVDYNYFPIDYQIVHTYPLKPVSIAWQEIQTGLGYIASFDPGTTTATVREITIAYYDSHEPQNYAQPVYVFSGDNNFSAYVPAISPNSTYQNTTQ